MASKIQKLLNKSNKNSLNESLIIKENIDEDIYIGEFEIDFKSWDLDSEHAALSISKDNKLKVDNYVDSVTSHNSVAECKAYLKDWWSSESPVSSVTLDLEDPRYAKALKSADKYEVAKQIEAQLNESLADVGKDDVGTTEKPAYAAAVRDLKKADKAREEARKLPEAPKHDEKPKNPKMVTGAKKMKLDESLFEIYDEDEFEDIDPLFEEIYDKIIAKFGKQNHKYRLTAKEYERYEEGKKYRKTFTAPNDYLAAFSMLLHTAPTIDNISLELDAEDFEDIFNECPTIKSIFKYAAEEWWGDGDDYIISLEDLTTGEFLYDETEPSEYDEDLDEDFDSINWYERKHPKKTKNVADKVYDALDKIGYNIFASSGKPGYRVSSKHEEKLAKAIEIAKKFGLDYDIAPSQGRYHLTIEIPAENEISA